MQIDLQTSALVP